MSAGGFGRELGGDPAGDSDRDVEEEQEPEEEERSRRGGFGRELGGDPAGDADRDTSQQEDETTDFGRELGGDPAGDADRDTSTDEDFGGFGRELGGDPAGDADRRTGERRDPRNFGRQLGGDPAGDAGRRDRVIRRFDPREEDVGTVREAAERLAARSEFIDPGDIQLVERDGQRFVRVDPRTARLLGAVGFMQGEEFIISGGLVGEAGSGEDIGFQGGDPEAILERQAEAAAEQAIAEQRVEAAGIQDPELREAAIQRARERIEVERGEDFELSLTREGQQLRADVSLTEQRKRAEAAGALEKQLFRQEGVSLRAGEGFEVVETDEGGFTAELTEAGGQEIQTQRTTEAVERLATGRGLPVTIPGARFLPGVATDTFIIGKGVEVPVPRGEIVGADPDVGQVDIPIPGTDMTFEEALGQVTAEVSAVTTVPAEPATGRPAAGPGVPSRLPEASDFTLSGTARGLARGAVETPFKLPTLAPLATIGLGKDVLIDFGSEVGGAAVEAAVTGETERLERIPDAVTQTTANVAVGATESFLRDPARTTGALAASLPVSVGLFKAARAAGPRASLATRGLLQPGEEIAGIGGFAITKRVAGERAAQRFFPHKEPLIFSEEAAIRIAKRAGGRVRGAFRSEAETSAARGLGFRSAQTEAAESRALIERAREFAERVDVETRMGAGAGAIPRVTVRSRSEATEPELITAEDIAPPRPMGRGPAPPGTRARLRRERARVGEPTSPLERIRGATETEIEEDVTRPELEQRVEQQLGLTLEEDLVTDVGMESAAVGVLTAEAELTGEMEREIAREVLSEIVAETEVEAEVEAELEQELELELEGEVETEAEVEAFLRDKRQQRRRRDDALGDEFEKTFTSPVATPEEVLSGLSEDVLDES